MSRRGGLLLACADMMLVLRFLSPPRRPLDAEAKATGNERMRNPAHKGEAPRPWPEAEDLPLKRPRPGACSASGRDRRAVLGRGTAVRARAGASRRNTLCRCRSVKGARLAGTGRDFGAVAKSERNEMIRSFNPGHSAGATGCRRSRFSARLVRAARATSASALDGRRKSDPGDGFSRRGTLVMTCGSGLAYG